MDEFSKENIVESIGLGCSLEQFTEWKEILGMVVSLKEDVLDKDGQGDRSRDSEKAYERFKYVVNQYKEQPHLLDSHLSKILDEIIYIVRSENISETNKHRAFQYMHLLTNVRGYKIIIQHLPHDAADLEPVLSMLEKQDEKDNKNWETRYCLLLWLCIIVKIPFHMSRLDSNDVDDNNTIIQRLFEVCKKYSVVGDLCRDVCAYLTALFLTRTDTKEHRLPEYFNWAISLIVDKKLNWCRFGPMMSVAAILKYGKREDLLPYAPKLLKSLMAMGWKSEPYRLCRKLAMKNIQRIGLMFLKARVISWRYKRGLRILPTDVSRWPSGGDGIPGVKIQVEDEEETDDEDPEVPPEIEDVIEELMQGLRDPDITVRWSAAKGIGRVMGRMSKQQGDDVVKFVLDLLNPRECDSAWHGGCLALAELSKRGLLLPARLPEVIPLVKKALIYDEPQIQSSVGAHIRDAACYLAWTFARAYDSQVFAPYVPDIATSLVVLTSFDREVNIRRAASAAFQEHIGRQGTFPHGIDILTAADYFTVGVRSNAYLNISLYIAQFKEYTTSLIDHLVDKKIEHWDIAIRDLSAKALHNLTSHATQYMIETVIPILLQKTSSIDANARHGSIIALGEIVYALSLVDNVLNIDKEHLSALQNIVKNLKNKHKFKDMSSELMKVACCQLIDRFSLARLPLSDQDIIEGWQELVDDCLCHEVSNIRSHAATALSSLSGEYYQRDNRRGDKVVTNYVDRLNANDEITRLGHALAIGSLPSVVLIGKLDVVIDGLIRCATLTPNTEKWVESRRQAVKSLTAICEKIGIKQADERVSCRPHILKILHCMIQGLEDYTRDDTGDTGAWVRESSMAGIQSLLQLVSREAPELLPEELVEQTITRIAQQAVERIDRTRAMAGCIFAALIHSDPRIPHIPEREDLVKIFPEEECKNSINWLSAVETFPRFTQMLALRKYTHRVLLGLIVSVGGLTESLVTASSNSLFDYLRAQSKEELDRICDTIVHIFETNVKFDMVVLSMLSFLDKVLSSGALQSLLDDPNSKFAIKIFNITRTVLTGSVDKFKLLGSIDVYCQLIQVEGEVCQKSLRRLMILLCHKFGWVRKSTAAKLYEALMLYPDTTGIDDSHLNTILNLLSETEWATMDIDSARVVRNKISELLGIPPPVPISKSPSA